MRNNAVACVRPLSFMCFKLNHPQRMVRGWTFQGRCLHREGSSLINGLSHSLATRLFIEKLLYHERYWKFFIAVTKHCDQDSLGKEGILGLTVLQG